MWSKLMVVANTVEDKALSQSNIKSDKTYFARVLLKIMSFKLQNDSCDDMLVRLNVDVFNN